MLAFPVQNDQLATVLLSKAVVPIMQPHAGTTLPLASPRGVDLGPQVVPGERVATLTVRLPRVDRAETDVGPECVRAARLRLDVVGVAATSGIANLVIKNESVWDRAVLLFIGPHVSRHLETRCYAELAVALDEMVRPEPAAGHRVDPILPGKSLISSATPLVLYRPERAASLPLPVMRSAQSDSEGSAAAISERAGHDRTLARACWHWQYRTTS